MNRFLLTLLSSVALAAIGSTTAAAQPSGGVPGGNPAPAPPPPPTVVAAPPPKLPTVALTFSPIHLLGGPIAELTGEVRVASKIGVAGIVGKGVYHVEQYATVPVWEVGASARYYLLGSFRRGLQLGAEAMYVHVDDAIESGVIGGEGLAVGPFVGYKYTHRIGFTFDGQLGVAYAAGQNNAESDTRRKALPIVNLNVGWSF